MKRARPLPECKELLIEVLEIMKSGNSIQGRGLYDEAVFRGLREGWLRDTIERIEAIENEGNPGA